MTIGTKHASRAEQIISGIEGATYAADFQVSYPDRDSLVESLTQIAEIPEGVATPESICELSDQLGRIAIGEDARAILITGNCSEAIVDPADGHIPAQAAIAEIDLVAKNATSQGVLHIRRDRGQNTKPRSESHETHAGTRVQSYMGDAINSHRLDERAPDPRRLVRAALQAVQLENTLSEHYGRHIPAAHEALNLYYEQAWLREIDGKRVLLSADLPWIGVRTNGTQSMQVDLLAGIENPIGVKVGPSTQPEHIRELQEKLNPARRIGKIVWMLRAGLDHPDVSRQTVESLLSAEEAPIVMYDIHGSTIKRADGMKIRSVERILQEIEQLYEICKSMGTKLHGLHLETTGKNRIECVDAPHETPKHEGGIDPQLNVHQLSSVMSRFLK